MKHAKCGPPKGDMAKIYYKVLVRWMYSFMDDVETETEFNEGLMKPCPDGRGP
jgi:hypothetical protein